MNTTKRSKKAGEDSGGLLHVNEDKITDKIVT
jgi:hypothetical protein